MNVKLHTPKSLKAGSGLSSLKQFVLSLVATTISIVLTFGTAAVIDHRKKEAEKHEMVMTVLYDFDRSIAALEKADTAFHKAVRLQQEVALHPEWYDSLRFEFIPIGVISQTLFSETTEKIFSSNIETFNTIGNVNFLSEVSDFYIQRQNYKEQVIDMLKEELKEIKIMESIEDLFRLDIPNYTMDNQLFLLILKEKRGNCMRMMGVSEQQMALFSQQRVADTHNPEEDSIMNAMFEEIRAAEAVISQARKKYN